jgi:hypothetical protein
VRDAVLDDIRSSLSFLDARLLRPVVIVDDPRETVVVHTLDPMTTEINVLWSDLQLYVLLARTVDGRRPPGYYRHEGRQMRVPLTVALRKGTEADQAAAIDLERLIRRRADIHRQIAVTAKAIRRVTGRASADFHRMTFAD